MPSTPAARATDGLIEPGGETENADWDGIWEAATARTSPGGASRSAFRCRHWASSLDSTSGISTSSGGSSGVWRRTAGRSPRVKYQVTQTSRAGLLSGLPDFSLGLGLSVRPAMTTGGGIPATPAAVAGDFQPSLDVTKRLGANVLGSLTLNTDGCA